MSELAARAKETSGHYLNMAFDMPSTKFEECIDILKTLIEIGNDRVQERYDDLWSEFPNRREELSAEIDHLLTNSK